MRQSVGIITIEELDQRNLRDVNRTGSTFTVDSELVLQAEDGVIRYAVTPTPPYQKHYAPDEIDYAAYVSHSDRAIFLAYVDGEPAGQIRLRRNWNQYAYVEDIVVDVHFRKQGVGRALMERAIEWAKAKRLPGIMLETQNNNVAACRLYERCGLVLGGFDRYLYKGITPDTEEIALYWYLVFG
jgi:streptothricin acetyltransferase